MSPLWLCCLFAILVSAENNVTLGAGRRKFIMERLDRSVIVVPAAKGVLISWRFFGSESWSISFNVYRDGTLLNSAPLTGATNYLDSTGSISRTYTLRRIVDGKLGSPETAKVFQKSYLSIPISPPPGGKTPTGEAYTYEANDGTPADVNGDGVYEIILKWTPTNSKDNSQGGYTGSTVVDCYTLAGQRLWRIDLGRNIRSGAHYTQIVAYDLDSDGKAEVMMKTADATVDGTGKVIGNSGADYRDTGGRVLAGPEFLTVFNGLTGAAMVTTNYYPPRGSVASWGDGYGNRVDRFLAGVAYIDGLKPSAIFARGYYTRAVVVAWNYRGGVLTKAWIHDSNVANSGIWGQGAHWFSVGDADGDSRHDIIYGAGTLRGTDGSVMYSTGLGHGDALHFGDLNPKRAGMEVFMVHENSGSKYGMEMHDAKTGAILWGVHAGFDNGRGLCADIDATSPGDECWSYAGGLTSASGASLTSAKPTTTNFAVWWDGDLLRELVDQTFINKWSGRMATLWKNGASANSGTKATPVLTADILGDWREEIILRQWQNTELQVYSTSIETTHRIPTLMHDPTYRCQVAGQNMAYNQPPHTGYFIGEGMTSVDQPLIAFP